MFDNDTIKVVEKIIHILPLLSFLFALLSFSIGIVVGHYQAIRRDKRKEFNEIAEPLLEYYEELLIQLQHEGYFSTTKFPIEVLGKVERRLKTRNQSEFNQLMKYIIAMQHPENDDDKAVLIKKIKRMCKIIHLR
ncbi:hypothetical protein RYR42_002612 [Edwardsiella piscicida]|uniref:Uncharacterized protein n=1 Tax=Edwardsiella phage GF-2 TaxID=1537091 RepID=A0A077KCC4_9CAUD|nr:hypothetical protein VC56_gp58 [Edwardsiella phage GF-2]ELM3737115.1 hypothetical protein [Edwardsiella piscicida]BAP28929.1 hypothetical protein [Edwardsiella phage GF-2]